MTGAARLTPGRGSPFVQRGGAIRPPGCEDTGGAIGDSIDLALRLAGLVAHRVPWGVGKTKSAQNCAQEQLSGRMAHFVPKWPESLSCFMF